jgi:hypothetical protein
MVNYWWFIQGWVRYYLHKFAPFLLRRHIREQVIFRESVASPYCKARGDCICGCPLPQLYYADKTCGVKGVDSCYPKMLSKYEWRKFVESNYGRDTGEEWGEGYGFV